MGEVKKGYIVVVCKRNIPFAKIVGLSKGERELGELGSSTAFGIIETNALRCRS